MQYTCMKLVKYNITSALLVLMAWCFSTRASVTTSLNTHPCVSNCLGVKRDKFLTKYSWWPSYNFPWRIEKYSWLINHVNWKYFWHLPSHILQATCIFGMNLYILIIYFAHYCSIFYWAEKFILVANQWNKEAKNGSFGLLRLFSCRWLNVKDILLHC